MTSNYKCGAANFDREVPGNHPKVYCKFGCGCWIYARPAPGCVSCSGLCNAHPSATCTTFICALSDCKSHAELRKVMRGEPSELERLPERTPEETTALLDMLDKMERDN